MFPHSAVSSGCSFTGYLGTGTRRKGYLGRVVPGDCSPGAPTCAGQRAARGDGLTPHAVGRRINVQSVLFFVNSILLVDLVIRGLNHVFNVKSVPRNLVRIGNPDTWIGRLGLLGGWR